MFSYEARIHSRVFVECIYCTCWAFAHHTRNEKKDRLSAFVNSVRWRAEKRVSPKRADLVYILTLCRASLHGVHAMSDTLPAVRRLRFWGISQPLPTLLPQLLVPPLPEPSPRLPLVPPLALSLVKLKGDEAGESSWSNVEARDRRPDILEYAVNK